MKKISRFTLAALLASVIIDFAGFAFGLFYAGVFYDNLAHFLTTFSLMALATELYFRSELAHKRGLPYVTAHRLLAVGAALALVGGTAWEGVEGLLDLAFPATIYNPLVDSFVDIAFGVTGGALGTWRTAAHLITFSNHPLGSANPD